VACRLAMRNLYPRLCGPTAFGCCAGHVEDVEVASQGSSSSLGLSSMHLRMDDMDILLQEDSVLEALVAGLADSEAAAYPSSQ
jgi:hypothetical protein